MSCQNELTRELLNIALVNENESAFVSVTLLVFWSIYINILTTFSLIFSFLLSPFFFIIINYHVIFPLTSVVISFLLFPLCSHTCFLHFPLQLSSVVLTSYFLNFDFERDKKEAIFSSCLRAAILNQLNIHFIRRLLLTGWFPFALFVFILITFWKSGKSGEVNSARIKMRRKG